MNPDELCCCGHTHEVHFGANCSKAGCSCEQFVWIDAGHDLLKALELLMIAHEEGVTTSKWFDEARAAIRKAKGL